MDSFLCDTCVRLRAEEERRRAAYDVTVKSLDKYSNVLTPEQIDDTKKLADEMWQKLDAAAQELNRHRLTHPA